MIYFLCIIGLVGLITVFLLFMFPRVEVDGDSMLPTFHSGELLRASRFIRTSKLKVGDIYVFAPPYDSGARVIKRLTFIDDSGYLFFEGDNKRVSYDSRQYGAVTKSRVIAHIVSKKGALRDV